MNLTFRDSYWPELLWSSQVWCLYLLLPSSKEYPKCSTYEILETKESSWKGIISLGDRTGNLSCTSSANPNTRPGCVAAHHAPPTSSAVLCADLGKGFIQVLYLQGLLGRVFTEPKFSKPKAKRGIGKFVTTVSRDVGLSDPLKYVAIYFGFWTCAFPSKNRTDVVVITGLQWDILESGPVFLLLSLLPFGSTADHCWIHACCARFWCGEDTQVLEPWRCSSLTEQATARFPLCFHQPHWSRTSRDVISPGGSSANWGISYCFFKDLFLCLRFLSFHHSLLSQSETHGHVGLGPWEASSIFISVSCSHP